MRIPDVRNTERRLAHTLFPTLTRHRYSPEYYQRTVNHIYGLENQTVEDKVAWTQVTYMRSTNTLMAMAGVVEGFPVTAELIRKYYKINPAFIMGTMKMRKVKSNQLVRNDASSDPEPVRIDKGKLDHTIVEDNHHDVVDVAT